MNSFLTVFVAILLLALLLGIFYLMPFEATIIAACIIIILLAYHFISRAIKGKQTREKRPNRWQNLVSLLTIFLFIFILFAVLLQGVVPSVLTYILLVALVFTLLMNYLVVPLAVIHKFREKRQVFKPQSYFPSVSIIIPAYNEEKLLSRTIENVLEADYPKKEIIVVDDGSNDSTYEIASRYIGRGIKVARRPNGGKFAALNTGLALATGEIIVTMDADSLISRVGIREIVRGFEDPAVGGVAGNLKVYNRDKFITKLQAMEYIVQIQVLRRAFENFGALTVASGAFSAFRKETLDDAGRYDPDYLLEDFDITIKLLKSHTILHGSNEALCYTEAPENLGDLYRQRLSWYRGDFQNFWKHRDVFTNPRFGIINRLTFPYMLLSMTLLPFASIIVLVTSVILAIDGEWMTLLSALALFLGLQFLLSALAILIAEDDMKLVLYSPLFIIGYKQLLDFTMIRALIDVIIGGGKYERRERVARIG